MMDKKINVHELLFVGKKCTNIIIDYWSVVLASQLTLEEGISPLAREFSGHTVIGCDEQLLETEDSLLISSEASVS